MNTVLSKSLLVSFFLLSSFSLFAQRCFKNTVTLSKVNLTSEVSILNFPAAKDPNAASMVITDESSGAALSTVSGKGVWIGKNSMLSGRSDISIAFSNPINSFELKISSINNDASGEEEVQEFSVFNEKGEDISAEAKFIWHTGAESGLAQSKKDATTFDPLTRTIKPNKEACCDFASGKMEIVCLKPFSKVFFRHKEIRLQPNGIILEGELVFCVSERVKPTAKNQKKNTLPVAKKEIAKPVKKKEVAGYETGKTVELQNVTFLQGKAELMSESYNELDKLARLMKENSKMRIEVRGHTDNIGNPNDNLVLSQERAAAVKKYLVTKGISDNRIVEKGFGGSKPLVENGTAAEHEKNRRVEIYIK